MIIVWVPAVVRQPPISIYYGVVVRLNTGVGVAIPLHVPVGVEGSDPWSTGIRRTPVESS